MSPKLEKNRLAAFGGGAVIGALCGLIGLGGAEFRLPLLISLFRFVALEAVILNTPELWKVRVTSVAGFRGPHSMAPRPGLAAVDLVCTLSWGALRD